MPRAWPSWNHPIPRRCTHSARPGSTSCRSARRSAWKTPTRAPSWKSFRSRTARLRYDEEVAQPLPRLRLNLDFMPSPSEEHPGLFIRDPYRFSDAMLIIPPPLVECLQCFDGQQTGLDLRASLVRATNNLEVGGLGEHLLDTLSNA